MSRLFPLNNEISTDLSRWRAADPDDRRCPEPVAGLLGPEGSGSTAAKQERKYSTS